jgi:hypothetical protein
MPSLCEHRRMDERAARGMIAIAGTVAFASAFSPRLFLSAFGIRPQDVNGVALFGWRLFAVRTGFLAMLAWRGNETAREAFLPIQILDQAVFWQAFATRSVPRRASLMAAAASGVIIALDLWRRSAAGPGPAA